MSAHLPAHHEMQLTLIQTSIVSHRQIAEAIRKRNPGRSLCTHTLWGAPNCGEPGHRDCRVHLLVLLRFLQRRRSYG